MAPIFEPPHKDEVKKNKNKYRELIRKDKQLQFDKLELEQKQSYKKTLPILIYLNTTESYSPKYTTMSSDKKAVIKNADMSSPMQDESLKIALVALDKFNIEKDIAAYIKKEFDKKYGPTWHCIVGRNFGSYVTHETKHFIYFYLGQVAILLFKSG